MLKLNVLAVSESAVFASAAGEKFFLHVAWELTVMLNLTYSCEILLYGQARIAFFKTL